MRIQIDGVIVGSVAGSVGVGNGGNVGRTSVGVGRTIVGVGRFSNGVGEGVNVPPPGVTVGVGEGDTFDEAVGDAGGLGSNDDANAGTLAVGDGSELKMGVFGTTALAICEPATSRAILISALTTNLSLIRLRDGVVGLGDRGLGRGGSLFYQRDPLLDLGDIHGVLADLHPLGVMVEVAGVVARRVAAHVA